MSSLKQLSVHLDSALRVVDTIDDIAYNKGITAISAEVDKLSEELKHIARILIDIKAKSNKK